MCKEFIGKVLMRICVPFVVLFWPGAAGALVMALEEYRCRGSLAGCERVGGRRAPRAGSADGGVDTAPAVLVVATRCAARASWAVEAGAKRSGDAGAICPEGD